MSEERDCPDGGACHHDCGGACWRVFNATPLSVAGWGERWPDHVRIEEAAKEGVRLPAEPRGVRRRVEFVTTAGTKGILQSLHHLPMTSMKIEEVADEPAG